MTASAPPIRVGFCGYGFSTRTFHLPFILLNPAFTVHAFLQRASKGHERGKESTHCLDDYPDAKWYRTKEDFMADGEIDLVVVATGHDSHKDLVIAALDAGKHVVVEKAFALSSIEADECIAAQRKSGKVLTVFQNRRYDSDFRTLSHLLNHPSKPLGAITECEIHYDVDLPAFVRSIPGGAHQAGGGLMFGLGTHTVDQALALFGRPTTVTGFYRALRGIKSTEDDSFTLILQYAGSEEKEDLIVSIKTSAVSKMIQPMKYFVRGRTGTYLKFGQDPQQSQITSGMKPSAPEYGHEPPSIHGTLTTADQFHPAQTSETSWTESRQVWSGVFPSMRGSYGDYYEDVVKAIRGEGEVVIEPELARDGLRVIELGRQSADEGRTLPMD